MCKKKRFPSMARLHDNLHDGWWWWIALIVFNCLDAITTYIALSMGFVEGSPIWHASITSTGGLVFKLIVVPCVLIPLLAAVINGTVWHIFIRCFALMLFEAAAFNLVGILRHAGPEEGLEAYSWLEMSGLVFLLFTGALVLLAAIERVAKWLTSRNIHIYLSEMTVGH